uniref:Putative HTH-type transcriptional regulator n=2 Tax=Betaproteobacteria TaxID=28216 RepID=B1N6J6_9PROT|nr:putative HTH-type transcriptional regulator [uncultured beta proteobacterium CBNPD1 BAC clone 578]
MDVCFSFLYEMGKTMVHALDGLDRELIAALQSNARMSTTDLAKRLRVARTTVVSRLSRLEAQGVIVGYTVRLGATEGREGVQAFVNLSVSPKAARSVVDRLSLFPELRQLAAVSGEFDYLAVLRASSTQRLDALLDEIGEIDGVIRTTTSVLLAMRIDRIA